MAIELTTPVVVPAEPEKQYNEIWLAGIKIEAPLNGACKVSAMLEKCRDIGDGTKEAAPGDRITVAVDNLWADVTADELAIMYALVAALKLRAGL